jgi:hypothetical protein
MYWAAAKLLISAGIITFASWLSNKKPELAGFIIALPLTSLLALAFSYAQHQDAESSVRFAKSILVAVPLSLTFFIPFLLAQKLPVGFWGLYALGIALLVIGYFTHVFLMKHIA